MDHPMKAVLTLGAAVEEFNAFCPQKYISYDNRNEKVVKWACAFQKELSLVKQQPKNLKTSGANFNQSPDTS